MDWKKLCTSAKSLLSAWLRFALLVCSVPSSCISTPSDCRFTYWPTPLTEVETMLNSWLCRLRNMLSPASTPSLPVLASTVNSPLMAVMTALYAVTKLWMAWVAAVVSGCTLISTGVFGSAAPRLSVTPGMTPVTVLLALSMGTPSTDNCASTPGAVVKFVAALLTVRLPFAPEVLLTSTSREPWESVTTFAVTP